MIFSNRYSLLYGGDGWHAYRGVKSNKSYCRSMLKGAYLFSNAGGMYNSRSALAPLKGSDFSVPLFMEALPVSTVYYWSLSQGELCVG